MLTLFLILVIECLSVIEASSCCLVTFLSKRALRGQNHAIYHMSKAAGAFERLLPLSYDLAVCIVIPHPAREGRFVIVAVWTSKMRAESMPKRDFSSTDITILWSFPVFIHSAGFSFHNRCVLLDFPLLSLALVDSIVTAGTAMIEYLWMLLLTQSAYLASTRQSFIAFTTCPWNVAKRVSPQLNTSSCSSQLRWLYGRPFQQVCLSTTYQEVRIRQEKGHVVRHRPLKQDPGLGQHLWKETRRRNAKLNLYVLSSSGMNWQTRNRSYNCCVTESQQIYYSKLILNTDVEARTRSEGWAWGNMCNPTRVVLPNSWITQLIHPWTAWSSSKIHSHIPPEGVRFTHPSHKYPLPTSSSPPLFLP